MRNLLIIGTLLATSAAVGTLQAQEDTFDLTVLSYKWTTTHQVMTFYWPAHANTSCSGSSTMTGHVSGGYIYGSGTTTTTCSTTYTPSTSREIDIQHPLAYMLAETATSRMVLTCTRKVRWSKCSTLDPGPFTARLKNGHLEVLTLSEKNKEEWVKYDIDQQTAINAQDPSTLDDRGPSAAPNEPQAATQGEIDASSHSKCPTSMGASVFAEAYGGAQALGAIPHGSRVTVDLSRSTTNFYWTEGTAFSDLFKNGSKLRGYVFRDCVKMDVQQTAINTQAPPKPTVQTAAPSIEAPAAQDAASEFPKRWKCMQNGEIHVLRFHGDYIYAEQILTEADAKTGLYFLYEFKKSGDKYVGTFKGRVIDGSNSCPVTFDAELTSVTKDRIEGRMLLPQMTSKIDWNTCRWSTKASWDEFSWIPVK